ncbi:MAG: flagellar hook-basal body complex protein FliE [Candidatus Sericytochromatia bacterium]|nr:flagellar hook-basal body complex protein FliE [Candidatus Sericytochromatia bacterium]
MLPIPAPGLDRIALPNLPPQPLPSGPSKVPFSQAYERALGASRSEAGPVGLPTSMEMRPPIAPVSQLSQPFVEFPQAVGADGLKLPEGSAILKDPAQGGNPFEFLTPLKSGLAEVTRLNQGAEKLANEAAIGGDVDLHDVMIAAEKASVAMQLTLQVRNKLVEVYQDVMRMQI